MRRIFIASLAFVSCIVSASSAESISEIQHVVDEILAIPTELRTFDNTLGRWIQLKNRLSMDPDARELLLEAEKHSELQFLLDQDFIYKYQKFLSRHRHSGNLSTSSQIPFYQPLQVKGDIEAGVSKNEEGTSCSGGLSIYDKDWSISAEATVKIDPSGDKQVSGEVKASYNFFDSN